MARYLPARPKQNVPDILAIYRLKITRGMSECIFDRGRFRSKFSPGMETLRKMTIEALNEVKQEARDLERIDTIRRVVHALPDNTPITEVIRLTLSAGCEIRHKFEPKENENQP